MKSLVVKRHNGSFLFALVPGGRQIAWPKLRALNGVNRLHLPDETAALEANQLPPRHDHADRLLLSPSQVR